MNNDTAHGLTVRVIITALILIGVWQLGKKSEPELYVDWTPYELETLWQCRGMFEERDFKIIVVQSSPEFVDLYNNEDFACDRIGLVPTITGQAIDDTDEKILKQWGL